MTYIDEEILQAKQQIKDRQKIAESNKNIEAEMRESIYDEVTHIFNIETHFEERVIEELGISIYMPQEFYLLSDELRDMFFRHGNPPSHVYIGDGIQFQMTFNHTEHKITSEQVIQFRDIAVRMLEKVGPKVKIIDKLTMSVKDYSGDEEKDTEMSVLQFVSAALDQNMFNIQFYLLVRERVLIGSVSFPSKKKKRLIPLAMEVIQSLKIVG